MKIDLFNDKDGKKRCWLINDGKLLIPDSLIIHTDKPDTEFVISVDTIGYNLETPMVEDRRLQSDFNGIIYVILDKVDNGLYLTGTIESNKSFFVRNIEVQTNSLTRV